MSRQRTLAVCAALGAGRGRIVCQLLTESMVLSLGGGGLGLAATVVVFRAVPALVPGDIVRLDEASLDGVVLAFTFGLSMVVGLAFGAVPAFQCSGSRLLRTLVESGARSTGGFGLLRANRARAVLAASQVALALVLLIGAVLLLRSFVTLVTVDRGYDHPRDRLTDPGHRRQPVGRFAIKGAAPRRPAAPRFSTAARNASICVRCSCNRKR